MPYVRLGKTLHAGRSHHALQVPGKSYIAVNSLTNIAELLDYERRSNRKIISVRKCVRKWQMATMMAAMIMKMWWD